jgi:hypothetical protein
LITYPSLQLKWNRPQIVNKVVLYDRPTLTEHMAASVLKFSDGSKEHVFAVPNDGSAKVLVFEPREVSSMRIEVVDGQNDLGKAIEACFQFRHRNLQ